MKKFLLILVIFIGSTLYGAVNRYSVITLENLTPYTVHYIYDWGPEMKANLIVIRFHLLGVILIGGNLDILGRIGLFGFG